MPLEVGAGELGDENLDYVAWDYSSILYSEYTHGTDAWKTHVNKDHNSILLAAATPQFDAGASRWFSVKGEELEAAACVGADSEWAFKHENPNYTCAATTPDCDAFYCYYFPLAIADDSSNCGVNLTVQVYKDGRPYGGPQSGTCPYIDIKERGQFIVEVYATETSSQTDCFGFFEEDFCLPTDDEYTSGDIH